MARPAGRHFVEEVVEFEMEERRRRSVREEEETNKQSS
jgi:hypothetical protein